MSVSQKFINNSTLLFFLFVTLILSSCDEDITDPSSDLDSLLIRDFNFHKNYHFSLVGDLENWSGLQDSIPKGGTVKIWVDDLNGTNNWDTVRAWARIDPNNPNFMDEEEYYGHFDLLVEITDYTIDPSNLVVDFNRAMRDDEVIAVSYETEGGLLVGDLSQEPYELKLIKPCYLDTTSFTWNYQLRNQYYMGSTDIIKSSIYIEIYKGDDRNPIFDEEINGVRRTYLNLFGLDDNYDGRVELSHIDFERGLLIFPDLKPFYQPHEKDGSPIPIEEPNRQMYYDDSPVDLGLKNNIYTIKVN
jgi:hypothetical protein